MNLQDAHVVVTGAAVGIGRALAETFHRAGARVVLADLHAPAAEKAAALLEETRPGSAIAVGTDVGTEHGNIELIRRAEEAFGTIDLFWANAGVGGGPCDLTMPEEFWVTAFAVNVHAHRWAAKHLLPSWLERGRGYFASTASAAGLLSQIGSAPYAVTKHGAVAFAEWLSITYGDRGISVSCLCPQAVRTAMLDPSVDTNPAADVARSAGVVLEPDEVADLARRAIETETFLIAPHPEVLTYWHRKVTDYDRWLAGMRRLQARMTDD